MKLIDFYESFWRDGFVVAPALVGAAEQSEMLDQARDILSRGPRQAELEATRQALARAESELGFLHKTKTQLEKRLVEQNSELAKLRGRVDVAEEDRAFRGRPIPRAIVVNE